jgi:tetratricopeptide (TPR) repeat protein
MRWLARFAAAVWISALAAGCVYYNGMYNANRLAGSARKAEREGRTFEANNLWGQVATKAESVVVRHPTSKYAEEASVLRGVALAKLGQCEAALVPLSRAALMPRSELTEEALLATGRCQLALGNTEAGRTAFNALLDSRHPGRRTEARFQHGRALRQEGNYQAALQSLEGISDPRASEERLLTLVGVGQLPRALALADSLLAQHDTARVWDSVVVAMGRENPAAASALIDKLQSQPVRSPEIRARQLLEDGIRLVPLDTAAASRRFHQAAELSGKREVAGRARLQLLLLDLRRISAAEELPPLISSLKEISTRYETVADKSDQLGTIVTEVHQAATQVTWETPKGDMRLFLAAEMARDSMRSLQLAKNLLRRILDDYPNSPYSAKVVLAVQQLDPAWADSARTLLEGRYSGSPYLAVIRGEDPVEYRQLEDSLGAFSATLSVRTARPDVRRGAAGRAIDQPKRRTPSTSRVPEQ